MAKVRNTGETKALRPAIDPEARENQLISLAVNAAEKQLLDGTASSQIIAHFLKLGTIKAQLEREKLASENELLKAKTEALESSRRDEAFYEKVLNAIRRYNGQGEADDY